MPTVRELKQQKSSVKQDYAIEGDGIRIEVRYGLPSDSIIPPPLAEGAPVIDLKIQSVHEHYANEAEDRARAEHRALRDRVFQYLRNHIAGFESKQRQLKKFVKANYGSIELRFVVNAANKEVMHNASLLDHLYGVVRFLRRGMDENTGTSTEAFFNEHFRNCSFRNDFWTYWNKRHNPSSVKEEAPAEVKAEPYRCPNCNQFVSRKTNWCKRCEDTVAPND